MTETAQLLLSGLAVGCIYGLIALGFVLIYKATEMVNFAQGELMMVGAFTAVVLVGWAELPYVVGFALTIVVLAGFGYLLDALVLRRVIGEPQFAVVMLTIGLGFIFRATAGWAFGYDPLVFETPFSGGTLEIGGVTLAHEKLAVVVGTILLCSGLYAFFRFTRIGVAMQAASQNQVAAYAVGIPVRRMSSLVWALSAGVAAVAGILMAPISLVDPNMGFLGIKAFAAAVLGGFGSVPGALLGGILIGTVEQFAGVHLPAGFQDTAAYAILLAVLVVRPEGIFAQIGRKKV